MLTKLVALIPDGRRGFIEFLDIAIEGLNVDLEGHDVAVEGLVAHVDYCGSCG